ncbi:MAG: gephyrin-like molybdotransferase Glp [Pseudomonadota bacterium]
MTGADDPKPIAALMSLEEARARAQAVGTLCPVETYRVREAHARTLAEPIYARHNQPGADLSAMDGYAVKAADQWQAGDTAAVAFDIPAGTHTIPTLPARTAARILTGAPVPHGADTVVIQENVRLIGEGNDRSIIFQETPTPKWHIRKAGFDFETGKTLLEAGHRLTDRDLGLLAGSGHESVAVRAKPRVVILATGDEIMSPEKAVTPTAQADSNTPMIAAHLEKAGGQVVETAILKDKPDVIGKALEKALGADLIVTIGGASVGDRDYIPAALQSLGYSLDVWKIAMRPGKPMIVANATGKPLVHALPGNPVSAYICAYLITSLAIRALMGDAAPPLLKPIMAISTTAHKVNNHRAAFLRAHLGLTEGRLQITADPNQDSAKLTTLAYANALLYRPPHASAIPAGETVPCFPLGETFQDLTGTG